MKIQYLLALLKAIYLNEQLIIAGFYILVIIR
jgi:hypothetical protein